MLMPGFSQGASSREWGDVSSLLENCCGILTKPRLCQTFPSQPAPSLRIPAAAEAPCAAASLLERETLLGFKVCSGRISPPCNNGTFGSSSG